MINVLRRALRSPRRRGSDLVELSLTLPVFLWVFFGIIEYGFYFSQRSGVMTAAQNGCALGATIHPNFSGETVATNEINALLTGVGVDCAGYYTGNCSVTVNRISVAGLTALQCDVDITYRAFAGYLPAVPSSIEGRGVSILEIQP